MRSDDAEPPGQRRRHLVSLAISIPDEQRQTAERVKKRVDEAGKWPDPIVTEIVAAGPFWPAEEYHQKYLVKNPGGYTCHYLRD
jgi:peptide methionine sulfoxide reductase msrA/msrB